MTSKHEFGAQGDQVSSTFYNVVELGETMPEARTEIDPPQSPAEQAAIDIAREYLDGLEGYRLMAVFGTPGGQDLDMRLCFSSLEDILPEHEAKIRAEFGRRLADKGVNVELDLLFMTDSEFDDGIRDLTELGDVTDRLLDGMNPHELQAAVGDTSMFSLYIFSTMRILQRGEADTGGTPRAALEHLKLKREGMVGWSHYYTAAFLDEYLTYKATGDLTAEAKYGERLAKFFSRVTTGSILAQLDEGQLDTLKPLLIDAVREGDERLSTDARMSNILLTHAYTLKLLDPASRKLLVSAGQIRNGQAPKDPTTFIDQAQSLLFYHAFQQGIDRRPERGDAIDPLTGYALGEFIDHHGERRGFAAGQVLAEQGVVGRTVFHIPLKTTDKQPNMGVKITVDVGQVQPHIYERTPGRIVGEGALFGLPRSATVLADGRVEAYAIDAGVIQDRLRDRAIREQLRQPRLESVEAREADLLLRYLGRQLLDYTGQSLPYSRLGSIEAARAHLEESPLRQYNLGLSFRDALIQFADPGREHSLVRFVPPVTVVEADGAEPRRLFAAPMPGEPLPPQNDRFYVVNGGTVTIRLQTGESVELPEGEFFGESTLLNRPATGTAELQPGSSVVSADGQWFKQLTQSRRLLSEVVGSALPPDLEGLRLVELDYHVTAAASERLIRRLITQEQWRMAYPEASNKFGARKRTE